MSLALTTTFVATQALYTAAFAVDAYLFSLPVNAVEDEPAPEPPADEARLPYIVLFYPVLRELESTMRTTFLSLGKLDYPADRYRVIAIPNADDRETVAALERLKGDFPFLDILKTPPTSDPSWQLVWDAWDRSPKAYWWHRGPHTRDRQLPPKKTRQLVYAFYHTAEALRGEPDLLINYIDADSCPPPDHFRAAAEGIRRYDVLQAKNVAGNLNASQAAALHAFDHMAWDGFKYPHLSADGRHPYWVLGKGLFFRAADLEALGGFHPWIAIEDPEVGLRFWANGKRLGILRGSLIEEVPTTFREGVRQRKRWVCGFLQTLGRPLNELGLTPLQRLQAWTNFLPCLFLGVNALGIPVGALALAEVMAGRSELPTWTLWLAAANLTAFAVSLGFLYRQTWRRTGLVLTRWRDRALYMLRVNPASILIWWLMWVAPLAIGLWMYLRTGGLVWQRTEKVDANHDLVRARYGGELLPGTAAAAAVTTEAAE